KNYSLCKFSSLLSESFVRDSSLQHFVCPCCHRSLLLDGIAEKQRDRIKEAFLICRTGQHRFQIRQFIPRFVLTHDITSSFGFEWNKHPQTQFDSVNGMRL